MKKPRLLGEALKLGASALPVDARTRLAYHEAGHAVLSTILNEAPLTVTIAADSLSHGSTTQRMVAQPSSLAQIYLAGFAAEHLLTGRRPRQLDQEIRFSILARNDASLLAAFRGADQSDGHRAVSEVLRFVNARTDDEILTNVNQLYDAARESLGSVWSAVQRVAAALLESEALSRAQVLAAIGRLPH